MFYYDEYLNEVFQWESFQDEKCLVDVQSLYSVMLLLLLILTLSFN